MKNIDKRFNDFEKKLKLHSEDIKKFKKFSPFFLDKIEGIERKISFLESKVDGLEQIISKMGKIDADKESLFEIKAKKNEMSIQEIELKVNKIFSAMKTIEQKIKKTEETWSSLDNSFLALRKESEINGKKAERGESFKILLGELKKHRESIIKSRRKIKEINEQTSLLKNMVDHLENEKIDGRDFAKLKADVEVLNRRLEEVLKILLEKSIG